MSKIDKTSWEIVAQFLNIDPKSIPGQGPAAGSNAATTLKNPAFPQAMQDSSYQALRNTPWATVIAGNQFANAFKVWKKPGSKLNGRADALAQVSIIGVFDSIPGHLGRIDEFAPSPELLNHVYQSILSEDENQSS